MPNDLSRLTLASIRFILYLGDLVAEDYPNYMPLILSSVISLVSSYINNIKKSIGGILLRLPV